MGFLFALINCAPPYSQIASLVIFILIMVTLYILRTKIVISLGMLLLLFIIVKFVPKLFKMLKRRNKGNSHSLDSNNDLQNSGGQNNINIVVNESPKGTVPRSNVMEKYK